MKTHTHLSIVVAAIISLGAGAALSRVIEPGVRVEKVMLATNTPALRIFPATTGPHPKALLAHGGGGSKEMLFRFGEAFAAAGLESSSISLSRWRNLKWLRFVAMGYCPLRVYPRNRDGESLFRRGLPTGGKCLATCASPMPTHCKK
jgi:hypothetical protein